MQIKNLKYLALGILGGYLGIYIYQLTTKPNITFNYFYPDKQKHTSVDTDEDS
ncbi:hypothetical protein [endosymbiont GvMRE of Glomus versiforme]|uniref:hypothetical protein n=1 Tax=endosymbiont GvMRE of Glomus versiforme TaxID=2039283 RepID=UPI000ECE2BC4|nr:hypothetical protein [endosymbiont GvMRE of Glomus versiforme]RHZ35558.1 hypothetical protein GvMRE_IIg12 [endosymbiont GvMRE of Glomus versiforme]